MSARGPKIAIALWLLAARALAERPRVDADALAAWDPSIHGTWGFGGGARASFSLGSTSARHHVKDELVFSAGVSYLYYPCPYTPFYPGSAPALGGAPVGARPDCPDAHVLFLPIALAWSFRVLPALDLFVEPGLGAFVSFFREACAPGACQSWDHAGLRPLVALGARARLGPLRAVARVGFPSLSLGLSF